MPKNKSESQPGDAGDRSSDLVSVLADMVTGSARFRVTQHVPAVNGRHTAHARAYSATGDPIPLGRIKAISIARWIMRTFPAAGWSEPHDFQMSTGRLAPSHLAGTAPRAADGSR